MKLTQSKYDSEDLSVTAVIGLHKRKARKREDCFPQQKHITHELTTLKKVMVLSHSNNACTF